MSAAYSSFEVWLASDDKGAEVTRMLTVDNADALSAARVAWCSGQVNACILNAEAMNRAFEGAMPKLLAVAPCASST